MFRHKQLLTKNTDFKLTVWMASVSFFFEKVTGFVSSTSQSIRSLQSHTYPSSIHLNLSNLVLC